MFERARAELWGRFVGVVIACASLGLATGCSGTIGDAPSSSAPLSAGDPAKTIEPTDNTTPSQKNADAGAESAVGASARAVVETPPIENDASTGDAGTSDSKGDDASTVATTTATLHIVVMGSSTPYGHGIASPTQTWARPTGYLDSYLNDHHVAHSIDDIAFDGNTSAGVLSQARDTANGPMHYAPDVIIVQLAGYNDLMTAKTSLQEFVQNLVDTRNAIPESVTMFFCGTDPKNVSLSPNAADTLRVWDQGVDDQFQTNFIEVFKYVSDGPDSNTIHAGWAQADGIHLTYEGQSAIATRIEVAIDAYLAQPSSFHTTLPMKLASGI